MIERVEIEQRLLHRLSGGLSAGELSEWARATLAFATSEGPTLFAPEEAMLLDVLKRCAVAADPPFELSDDDLLALLRRVAFSGGPAAANGTAKGPFLVAFRARMVPRAFFRSRESAVVADLVRLSEAMLPKARRSSGALACLWCARALPGMVVGGADERADAPMVRGIAPGRPSCYPRPCVKKLIAVFFSIPTAGAVVAVFLLAGAETALLIGFLVPGEVAAILGGVLASRDRVPLLAMLAAAIAGAACGDSIGFFVGRRAGGAMFGRRRRKHWSRARAFLKRGGSGTCSGVSRPSSDHHTRGGGAAG